MASWQQRLLPLALGLTVFATSPAWADNKANTNDEAAPLTKHDVVLSPEAKKARLEAEEKLRLKQVTQDANAFSGMVASELALLDGNKRGAMGAYAVLLERTGRPEMAERAMQIAIGQGALGEAQIILDRWRKIEPIATPAQSRMNWELEAAQGNLDKVLQDLPAVLRHADENQARRIFLLLSQLSLADGAANKGYEVIKREVKSYPNMPEAAVTEAMYAALSKHDKEAVQALKRLAKLDADIRPSTELAIGVLAQRAPNVISQFFAQTQTSDLSVIWQELQIDALVRSQDFDQAYQLVQKSLREKPSPDLYIQAGILAMKTDDFSDAEFALNAAYQTGDADQRMRAATLLSVLAFGQKDRVKGQKWADLMTSPAAQFDKGVILATAAAEDKDWAAMRRHLNVAKNSTPPPQSLYDQSQYFNLEMMWLRHQDDAHEAYKQYTQLIEAELAKPQSDVKILASLHGGRGILLVDKLNRPDEALVDLAKQLHLLPNDPDAMNALGYTMLSKENLREQGFVLVERAFKLDPEAAHINDSLGWAYFLKGQPEKALVYLKFAYDKYPDPEVAAHLVETYRALGNEKLAQEFAQKGLKLNAEHPVLLDTLKRLNLLPKSEVKP